MVYIAWWTLRPFSKQRQSLRHVLGQVYGVTVIYRLNFYDEDKLTGTELVEASKVQEANELARRAVKTGRALRAEVQYTTGGIAFRAGPTRST